MIYLTKTPLLGLLSEPTRNIKEEANDTNSLSLRGDRKIPKRLGQKLYQAAVSGGNKNVQFFEFDEVISKSQIKYISKNNIFL